MVGDDVSLGDARDWLRERVDSGERCPCCKQFAKVYRRKLNSTNAMLLIRAYRVAGCAPFHAPTVLSSHAGGEWARLLHWGLIADLHLERDDGGHAGWWRVTEDGERFVKGRVSVPKYVRIYDGRCLGLQGDLVSIRDCLGEKFDYAELMAT